MSSTLLRLAAVNLIAGPDIHNFLGLLEELHPLTSSRSWRLAHVQWLDVDADGFSQGVRTLDATLAQWHLWLGPMRDGRTFFICITATRVVPLRL